MREFGNKLHMLIQCFKRIKLTKPLFEDQDIDKSINYINCSKYFVYLIKCYLKFLVNNDLLKRNKKQTRGKGVPSTPEIEPNPETEKTPQQVLMVEIENLKDEPYDKTMEIKVRCIHIFVFHQFLIMIVIIIIELY